MPSLYLKRQNTILSILEKENSREPKKTIYIILWVVPMKDWVIKDAELYFRKATVGSAEPDCILL